MKRKRIILLFSIAFALLLAGLGWLVALKGFMRGTLLVEARFSHIKGEQQPAASATLYLLDRDMMKLALVKEGEENSLEEKVFRENPKLRNLAGVMNARRREAYSLGPDIILFMEQSRPLWQPHVIQTARADSGGRARFYNLEPGSYWFMGSAETPDGGVAFWNLFVTISRGENRLTLEPLNSLQCSSCQ